MDAKKIVITGVAGGAVSSAAKRVRDAFCDVGYTVQSPSPIFFSREDSVEQMLRKITDRLYEEETLADEANNSPSEKTLILCEGGVIDAKALIPDAAFALLLESLGCGEVYLRDGYDAVFCVTDGDFEAEESIISAWTGNPHLRIIDYSAGVLCGEEMLIRETMFFAGEPEPLEIERKYLIEYPDISLLESIPMCRKVEISQTYTKNAAGENVRLRRRGGGGSYIYIQTQKKSITPLKRIETERRLSEAEYSAQMRLAKEGQSLTKDRYCLLYGNRYFEIDVYPFWDDRAIMEIELLAEDEEVLFPDFIHIIREVTEDRAYSNHALAKAYGEVFQYKAQ